MAEISQIKLPNGDTFDLVDEKSGYITVETDPVFSTSAAAGITTANITSWDNKVSKSGDTITGTLVINSSGKSKKIEITYDKINFYDSAGNNYVTLKGHNGDYEANYSISLPLETGTLALDSEIPTKTSDLTNDSGYITSYTETDPVFSASAAAGITATDISNWNSKAAGDHQHGNIGNTGHITTYDSITSGSRLIFAKNGNWEVLMTPESMAFGTDSTKYLANNGNWQNIPTNTDTTYILSNTLSSHKFTSTLTAGGSGSGTSTATMEFVAGTGITLTDDTTNKKITIASSVVNTDEKVSTNVMSSSTGYYLIFGTNTTSAETKYYNTAFNGSITSDTSVLKIGKEGEKTGELQLHGSVTGTGFVRLYTSATSGSNFIEIPGTSGTLALTSDIPSVYSSTNTGGYLTMATLPIYDGTVV